MKRSYTTKKKKKESKDYPITTVKRKNTALGMIPKNMTTLHIRSDLNTNLLYNIDIKQGSF